MYIRPYNISIPHYLAYKIIQKNIQLTFNRAGLQQIS